MTSTTISPSLDFLSDGPRKSMHLDSSACRKDKADFDNYAHHMECAESINGDVDDQEDELLNNRRHMNVRAGDPPDY